MAATCPFLPLLPPSLSRSLSSFDLTYKSKLVLARAWRINMERNRERGMLVTKLDKRILKTQASLVWQLRETGNMENTARNLRLLIDSLSHRRRPRLKQYLLFIISQQLVISKARVSLGLPPYQTNKSHRTGRTQREQ